MSIIDEIRNIKKLNKTYLYHRILYFLDQKQKNYLIETQNQLKIGEISLKENIIIVLETYAKDNSIDISHIDKNQSQIEQYLTQILNYIIATKQSSREFHVKILKNLLSSKKGNEAIKKYSEKKSEALFSLNDFIVNYTKFAFGILFNKNFPENDFDKLNEAYLHFLFQIKNPDYLKKLNILIYTYLYDKDDMNEFIEKSSIEMVKKELVDNSKLINLQLKYNEFNININKIKDNRINFFVKNLEKNIPDFLNFLNPEELKKKSIYIDDEKLESDENMIVVDDLVYKANKIHLFSTEFLIVNGFKSKY